MLQRIAEQRDLANLRIVEVGDEQMRRCVCPSAKGRREGCGSSGEAASSQACMAGFLQEALLTSTSVKACARPHADVVVAIEQTIIAQLGAYWCGGRQQPMERRPNATQTHEQVTGIRSCMKLQNSGWWVLSKYSKEPREARKCITRGGMTEAMNQTESARVDDSDARTMHWVGTQRNHVVSA